MTLLGDVEKSAQVFHSQREELERRRATLHEAVRRAAGEGIPAAKIARAAGLSRERIRQIVAEGGDDVAQ